jgi:hypothetical protein
VKPQSVMTTATKASKWEKTVISRRIASALMMRRENYEVSGGERAVEFLVCV